jgi:hypothetical protein
VRLGSTARNRACKEAAVAPTDPQAVPIPRDRPAYKRTRSKNAERAFVFSRKVLRLIKVYDEGGGWIQGQPSRRRLFRQVNHRLSLSFVL